MEAASTPVATAPKVTKTRRTSYLVFRFDRQGITHLTSKAPVKTTNRKEAIKVATADFDDDAKAGRFAVVPADQWWETSRSIKTEQVDDFA